MCRSSVRQQLPAAWVRIPASILIVVKLPGDKDGDLSLYIGVANRDFGWMHRRKLEFKMNTSEIVGIYVRETIRFDETSAVSLVILAGDHDRAGERISIVGKCEENELQPQLTYLFSGSWGKYKNRHSGKTVDQFKFHSFVPSKPLGKEGVISYLEKAGEGYGIRRARAAKLWDLFGANAVRIAREDPETVADSISGVSLRQATLISAVLQKSQATELCAIQLAELLNGRGLPKSTAATAIKIWGASAASVIANDPFAMLRRIPGCGYRRCDNLWREYGLSPRKIRRQMYAVWDVAVSGNNGSVWIPAQKAIDTISDLVGGTDARPRAAVVMGKRVARLDINSPGAIATIRTKGSAIAAGTEGDMWIAEASLADAEDHLAKLCEESLTERPLWPSTDSLELADDHQKSALKGTFRGTFGVLGGGPGTGKTFTAAEVIKAWIKEHGASKIAIGAPTGKAAVRITEAMQTAGLNLQARTWHSLLGIERGSWRYHGRNKWPYKLIVGDEESMKDTRLACAVMDARPKGAHYLACGDVNQITPIAPGAPLRDIILADMPYGELTEIKRNSGGIVEACAAIRQGEAWEPSDNLHMLATKTPDGSIASILETIHKSHEDGFNSIWDCQVVVPLNSNSPLSRHRLNRVLQLELNNNSPTSVGDVFRPGDKIVNTQNCEYEDEITKVPHYVANGELAEVLRVEPKFIVASLQSPERVIKIPKGKQVAVRDGVDSDKPDVTGCSWELGYALSVHKAQGSEWPVVITVIDEYPSARMVCSREWVYTAISRAKVNQYLVGRKLTADKFCRRIALNDRKTFLREKIIVRRTERTFSSLI